MYCVLEERSGCTRSLKPLLLLPPFNEEELSALEVPAPDSNGENSDCIFIFSFDCFKTGSGLNCPLLILMLLWKQLKLKTIMSVFWRRT